LTRFFVFGCSYTAYAWPTWADLLALNYDHYENWAIPGLGNRAIFERLVEAHCHRNLSKDDLVIIQWSTHLRHDWFSRYSLKDRLSGWKTSGSIFSTYNENVLDKKWQQIFFDEFAYVMHSYNFIFAAQNILDKIGCKWLMTSIGDIRKLGYDIIIRDENFKENLDSDKNSKTKYPDLSEYEECIWENNIDRWVDPILPNLIAYKDKFFRFRDPKNVYTIDYHPTPYLYQKWLDTWAEDRLEITMDRAGQDLIVNSVENMYEQKGKNKLRDNFDDLLCKGDFKKPVNMHWPNFGKGFH
jgi:hypothetical protein